MICKCHIKVDAGLPNLNTEDEAPYEAGGVTDWVGGGGGANLAEKMVCRHVNPALLLDMGALIELKFKIASLTFLFRSKKLQTLDKGNKNTRFSWLLFQIFLFNCQLVVHSSCVTLVLDMPFSLLLSDLFPDVSVFWEGLRFTSCSPTCADEHRNR